MKTMKQIILDAADILRNVGWTQGQFIRYTEDAEGRSIKTGYCAYGAIRAATGQYNPKLDRKDAFEAREAARAIAYRIEDILKLNPALGKGHTSLVGFNDTGLRSVEEVLTLFQELSEIIPDEAPPIETYEEYLRANRELTP